MNDNIKEIEQSYQDFINVQSFPCIGAKAALAKGGVNCMVAGHIACPTDDMRILDYLYAFTERFKTDRLKLQSSSDFPGTDSAH